jgi:hypothetical protein
MFSASNLRFDAAPRSREHSPGPRPERRTSTWFQDTNLSLDAACREIKTSINRQVLETMTR